MKLETQSIRLLRQNFLNKAKHKDAFDYVQLAIRELRFFKEKQELFDPNLYQQLIRKVQLVSYKKGDVVFHYGSNDLERFYVIYQGQVAILCPKDNTVTHQQILQEYENGMNGKKLLTPMAEHKALSDIIMAQAYGNFLGINIKRADKAAIEEEYANNPKSDLQVDKWIERTIKSLFPSLKIVNMCSVGDQFGEIALIGKGRRTATVLCTTDCEIVTLANPDFQAIIKQYHEQMKNDKISLLRKFPLFSRLSNQKMQALIELITVCKPKMFSVIYAENSKPEFLYFIKAGEVELLKEVDQSKTGPKKMISIALLQVGCVFGYDEAKNNKLREYRAISKSNQCELYVLPLEVVQQINFTQGKEDIGTSTEQNFHSARIKRLLSGTPLNPGTKVKKPQDDIENYREFFDKDFDSITRIQVTKRILSPQHRKMISEPFVAFFQTDPHKLKRNSISIRTSKHSIDNSSTARKTPVNIHRHLFSPRISLRQLHVMMPFKKHLIQLCDR